MSTKIDDGCLGSVVSYSISCCTGVSESGASRVSIVGVVSVTAHPSAVLPRCWCCTEGVRCEFGPSVIPSSSVLAVVSVS